MKIIDIARLILFIFLGMSIYFYMGSMLAAEEYPFKPMIYMKAQEAYAIWDLVNELEEFWQVKYKRVIKDGKIFRVGEDVEVSVDKNKLDTLRSLVAQYEYLSALIEALIVARIERNIKEFVKQKEKIMQELAPIFADAIYKERKKEQERKSKEGWLAWIKNNITSAANRFYQYLFPEVQKK